MWVETGNVLVKPGKTVTMKFPSDHAFPAHHNEYIKAEEMATTYILSPSGRKIAIKKQKGNIYRSSPLRETGTHLIVSGKKWLYWTQTTNGWKVGKNKRQVKNPIKGVYSGKFAKSLITVTRPGGKTYQKRTGHDLEIIPLANPSLVKKNGYLTCKVIFKGRPYRGPVKATYAGYSTKKNVFAVTTRTNSRGTCRIRLNRKGPWLIKAGLRLPAKGRKKALCDQILYSATLTFTR